MIRHTVAFTLKHGKASGEEKQFLEALAKLAAIPGVQKFEIMRQTGKKNGFTFGVSMEFDAAGDYDSYNRHPEHVAFVQNVWLKEVTDFLETDFEPLNDR